MPWIRRSDSDYRPAADSSDTREDISALYGRETGITEEEQRTAANASGSIQTRWSEDGVNLSRRTSTGVRMRRLRQRSE